MLLNKGQFGDKRILSEKAVEEMETAQFAALPVKSAPRTLPGAHYGLGAWIMETGSGGNATVFSCPNLLGTAPYIDTCRKYAAILIVLKPQEDPKRELFLSMKGLVDEQVPCGN
jgi:CubicO group peptidase (beta-lactamase class C family)